MYQTIADFYNPSVTEFAFFFFIIIFQLVAVVVVGINILLFVVSRITGRKLNIKNVFFNKKALKLYKILFPILAIVIIEMIVYFGLLDN